MITVEALEADPFPIYARLREEEPVCFVPAVGLHLVTRWDDVQYVATHPEIFTAEVDASPLARTLGATSSPSTAPTTRGCGPAWMRRCARARSRATRRA